MGNILFTSDFCFNKKIHVTLVQSSINDVNHLAPEPFRTQDNAPK